MTDNTQVREKKAAGKITTYAKALGVLASPVLAYFLTDVYTTMKSVNSSVAALEAQVEQMRDRDVDNMRRNMVTMLRDLQQIQVRVEVMERVYELAPWEWSEPRERWSEDIEQKLADLEGDRDYYEEFEQYQEMEQNNAPPMRKGR